MSRVVNRVSFDLSRTRVSSKTNFLFFDKSLNLTVYLDQKRYPFQKNTMNSSKI